MANLKSLEYSRNKILRELTPVEMEAYIKKQITNLYESYLTQDLEKALASKRLIEEATSTFKAEGYTNTLSKELEFRLAKANEVLVATLEEKNKLEVDLTEVIIESIFSKHIRTLSFSNYVLELLFSLYEIERSKNILKIINAVAERVETEVVGINFLLEDISSTENNVPEEDLQILKEYYSAYADLVKKINNL